ncbi:MAG: DUF3108 domain-containing protein [Pseudomonadota bacterium]|nr:DUF3108 domain-containing protein [Pseudomonadota bacterium]
MLKILLLFFSLPSLAFSSPLNHPQSSESIESIITPLDEISKFTIIFEAKYGGLKGKASLSLNTTERENEYIYLLESNASGIARLIQPETAIESSNFKLTPEGIKPLHYIYDEGTRSEEDRGSIIFDWSKMIAESIHKGELIELKLENKIQDRLSAELQTILQLRLNQIPSNHHIAYNNSIRNYKLKEKGEENISVPAGNFDTVKYLRQREGSKRSSLIWFAKDFHYLPIRIDQLKNDEVSISMNALSINY